MQNLITMKAHYDQRNESPPATPAGFRISGRSGPAVRDRHST
jgi:hypothetical protein